MNKRRLSTIALALVGAVTLTPLTAGAQDADAVTAAVTVDCTPVGDFAGTATLTITAANGGPFIASLNEAPPMGFTVDQLPVTMSAPLDPAGGYGWAVEAADRSIVLASGSDAGHCANPAPASAPATPVVQATPTSSSDGWGDVNCDACDRDNASGGKGSGFYLQAQCYVGADGNPTGKGRIRLRFTNRETVPVIATAGPAHGGQASQALVEPGQKADLFVEFSGPSVTIFREARTVDGRTVIPPRIDNYPCPCEGPTTTTTQPPTTTPPPGSSVPPATTVPPAVPPVSTPGVTVPPTPSAPGVPPGITELPSVGWDAESWLRLGVIVLAIGALCVACGRAVRKDFGR